jgi:hypothetical protein
LAAGYVHLRAQDACLMHRPPSSPRELIVRSAIPAPAFNLSCSGSSLAKPSSFAWSSITLQREIWVRVDHVTENANPLPNDIQ